MALEALTQQDQLDARFARAFSPIDRLGAIPVSIAELNLARQRDETARLQKLFDTVQEQTFRSTENETERTARADENKAYREYARTTMEKQQEGINTRNDKLEKLRRETDLEERKINTVTYKELRSQRDKLAESITALSEIPISVRNQAARKLAETVVKDAKILDKYFRLDSATDNSNNFGKIPGGEMLDGDYQKAILSYQLPRNEEAKRLQMRWNELTDLMRPLAAHMDLRGAAGDFEMPKKGGASASPDKSPLAEDPLAVLKATVAARNAAAAKAVEAEAAPIPNTALGIPPLNQIFKPVASAMTEVGEDMRLLNPMRGLGNALENIVTGAPVRLDTPEEQARKDSVYRRIADQEGYGVSYPWNAAVNPSMPAPAMQRFPSVSPAGPFGMPLNDSEIPGLRMLLKEGVNGQMFDDDSISSFFNDARRNPGGMQMKAIQLLREKLMKRSAGIPDVPTEAAPYGGPSNLFNPSPALRESVFPITPLPR